MKYIFSLSLPLYAFDRATKYWVLHSIDPGQPIAVVPNFFHHQAREGARLRA